ncbi:MAG: 4-hydroxy-tetrahydrodipicolinate reductase [Lachnospiraceae bacterium]|nr:4-hydroxy-tetrahydrodipicolinate reductase [Lachnospiraceae bacterium]
MTRIIMHGCNGKMGQVITGICNNDPDCEIVAGIDISDHIKTNNYPVFSNINECTIEADVVVDFASAKAVDGLLDWCKIKKVPLVLCTTGLSDEQVNKVMVYSKEVAILRSANMSLGINMLLKELKNVASILAPSGFDIEIVEKHHNQKVDAPSGTALALADSINDSLGNEYHYVYDRSSVRQKRDAKEIGISAVRGGSIVGEHEVIFAGPDEVITITHTAYSKALFANGAVQAAKYLKGKPAGLYDMSGVIG